MSSNIGNEARQMAFINDPANKKLLVELELRKRAIEKELGCTGQGSPEASQQLDVYRKMALAKVPLKFWDNEIKDLEERRVRIIARKYVNNIDHIWQKGWGLFIYGRNGTGKSMLASIILKEAIKQGFQVYFTSLSEVLQKYCDSMYNPELRRIFEEEILSADFLVLDDIDKAYHSEKSTFIDSAYDYLFRTRANKCLPIIVTSNVKRDEFIQQAERERSFGTSLLSLFGEHLHDVRAGGADRRQGRLKRELEEFFNGNQS